MFTRGLIALGPTHLFPVASATTRRPSAKIIHQLILFYFKIIFPVSTIFWTCRDQNCCKYWPLLLLEFLAEWKIQCYNCVPLPGAFLYLEGNGTGKDFKCTLQRRFRNYLSMCQLLLIGSWDVSGFYYVAVLPMKAQASSERYVISFITQKEFNWN